MLCGPRQFGEADVQPVLSEQDARLASMLEQRELAGHAVAVVAPEHRQEIWEFLDRWVVARRPADPDWVGSGTTALRTIEAFAVVEAAADPNYASGSERMSDWCAEQAKRGRGIFLRGNPLNVQLGLLGAYATGYLDIALSARRPGYLLQPPPDGWRDSSELSEVGTAELVVRNYPWAVAGGLALVLVSGLAVATVIARKV